MNLRTVRSLDGGYSTDLTDNVEKKNTYQKAINGRLYSKNGVVSFSGGKGTKLIYNNSEIVKYLGYYAFSDELIVFAKCLKSTNLGGSIVTICEDKLIANSFVIQDTADNNVAKAITTEISDNTSIITDCYDVAQPPTNPADFSDNYSSETLGTQSINFGEYYTENANVPNQMSCSSSTIGDEPINNQDYYDCILSLKIGADGFLNGTLLWVGTQNWPMNGKITTAGINENQFYKRVYYTDAVNPRRVVNLKDTSLAYRNSGEFEQVLNNVLLQPEIVSVVAGGQLNAMKTLYVYRIISENGQLSEFSPTSFFAQILVEDTPIRYRGGDVSEATGKTVNIRCNIVNPEPSSEVECIALEYEAYGPPTAIRNLGRKAADYVVDFQHFGSEAEFADNITYNDIINYTNTWKYCNDFATKKQKLLAAGLRNEPIPTDINNLEYLFPLHSWASDGSTHNTIINPEPWNYRYIDPSNTDTLVFVKQKVYRTLSSFGPLTITFKNVSTGNYIEKTYPSLGIENYSSILANVIEWLLDEQSSNVNWTTYFPNLTVSEISGQLLLSPTDDLIQTDMANYVFESSNNQFIENFDNQLEFINITLNLNNLVHGAQSIGWNDGTGLRITYRQFKEPLLNQATSKYDGTGTLLDYIKPSEEKYCMKGEIYRLAFQAYNLDSTRFFAIPLGDVMIPNLGDIRTEIDDSGNAIITSEQIVNQSVENGVLYGHGIKMHIEVRLNCDLQKLIPMYQILYVERTEDNRTILCQGISAPLMRVQTSGGPRHGMPDAVTNKWNLPYFGGPVYEKNGFFNVDTYGENDDYTGEGSARRVYQHRGLFYFDSPDLYFQRVSDNYVNTSELNIVAKLNTDHTPSCIMESGELSSLGSEVYPKFSRKILHKQVDGDVHNENLPRYNIDEGSYNGSHETYWINVSVYANYTPFKQTHQIDRSVSLKYGEVISGSALGINNDLSNNTFGLPSPSWFYSGFARKWDYTNDRSDFPKCDIFAGALTSPGYPTVFIKSVDNLFTDSFVGPLVIPRIHTYNRFTSGVYGDVYDTVPLINLYRNNRESVYGGRSVEAYSKNTYIPLSRTIPTLQSSTNAQAFDVGADVYVTLNIRTKNDAGDDEIIQRDFNNHGGARDRGDLENVWLRNAAWAYCVVLETQVEPKLTYGYEFYRESSQHSFEATRPEVINEAYFNENNLKSYVPKPFKFKDDPNRGHVIAVSDVKLPGETYDSWTVFKVNNFYNLLEKDKGDISNLVKEDEEVFAIQEQQTSLIYIGTDRILTDTNGSPVNIQQGSGSVVDGHKIVSNYGTSIRRAVVESDYGFCFFDERKIEFVKIIEPLLVKNLLHLEYFERFKNDPIVDTEAYFDHQHKETCIRLRTTNNNNFLISYNEVQKVFNGEFSDSFDKDIFMMFDQKVYSPIRTVIGNDTLSENLHQLNEGDILNFFDEQNELTLGLYMSGDIDKVIQYKQAGLITNLDYPVKCIFIKSNLGYDRIILGEHDWYKIREGTHTVPMINDTKDPDPSDVRGNWVYLEITAESLNKNKVDILAVLNDIRVSHQ